VSGRGGAARVAVTRLSGRTRRLSVGARGALIVCVGVFVLSPDSLLIRLITVDEGTLLLLRGGFSVIGYLVLLQLLEGGAARWRTWVLSRPELAIGGLLTAANVCFVTSIVHANAARALVIVASAPAFTSVFSRFFAGEVIAARTWVASWVVLAGVAAIVTEPQGGELIGALAALGASVILAAMLVVRQSR